MARGKRDNLIRLYNQTQNDFERVLKNIREMTEIYGEIKPEYTEFLECLAVAVISLQEQMKTFRYRDM